MMNSSYSGVPPKPSANPKYCLVVANVFQWAAVLKNDYKGKDWVLIGSPNHNDCGRTWNNGISLPPWSDKAPTDKQIDDSGQPTSATVGAIRQMIVYQGGCRKCTPPCEKCYWHNFNSLGRSLSVEKCTFCAATPTMPYALDIKTGKCVLCSGPLK